MHSVIHFEGSSISNKNISTLVYYDTEGNISYFHTRFIFKSRMYYEINLYNPYLYTVIRGNLTFSVNLHKREVTSTSVETITALSSKYLSGNSDSCLEKLIVEYTECAIIDRCKISYSLYSATVIGNSCEHNAFCITFSSILVITILF